MEIADRESIVVTVVYDEEEFELTTYTNEYRNLMMLIFDKMYVEDFGECGGMGRCATCVIEILESSVQLPDSDRNENATIKKTGISESNIRLACQIPITPLLHNIKVRIRQDRYFNF